MKKILLLVALCIGCSRWGQAKDEFAELSADRAFDYVAAWANASDRHVPKMQLNADKSFAVASGTVLFKYSAKEERLSTFVMFSAVEDVTGKSCLDDVEKQLSRKINAQFDMEIVVFEIPSPDGTMGKVHGVQYNIADPKTSNQEFVSQVRKMFTIGEQIQSAMVNALLDRAVSSYSR